MGEINDLDACNALSLSLRLTHKITAIGIIGVVGVVLIGGIHLYGEKAVSVYRDAAADARTLFELNSRVNVNLREMRRAEKDFLLRNDPPVAEHQVDIGKTVSVDIEQLDRRIVAIGKPELVGRIEAMGAALKQYQAQFAIVVEHKRKLGLNEESGLEGRLRASVHAIEAKVEQSREQYLLVSMLTMRRHEKDFMLRRDRKYGDEMKRSAGEFLAGVDSADITESTKAELRQRLAEYQRDFADWMETALTLSTELRTMSETFSVVEPVIDAASKSIDDISIEADRLNVKERDTIQFWIAIAIAAIAILVLSAGILIGRSVGRPLTAMTAAMSELANGNFAIVLPGLGRSDEIGNIARAIEAFKVKAEQKARDEATAKLREDQIAAEQRRADMHRLADQFETAVCEIVETISSASTELEASASTLRVTAEQAQEQTGIVAGASEEASTNVQSVASATEELSSSVNEISRQVRESARMAGEAVGQTRSTTERIGELSRAASRIGDVVELINTIAGQTNLLALNATIEAARAGETGRGFAVVASEVKALAQQTAKATGEIAQQITGIQAATEESVVATKEISATIERLSEVSSTIAAAVEEQGAATKEISRSVQQAAQGTEQVSIRIIDVQQGASETGAASSQVLTAAQSLSRDSSRLRNQVAQFLATVRAA